MPRKTADQEQITIRLPKKQLAQADKLWERMKPLVASRADILRMVFDFGFEAAEKTAAAYENPRKDKA